MLTVIGPPCVLSNQCCSKRVRVSAQVSVPEGMGNCNGLGHPCKCGEGCPKSCKTWWIGDNPILGGFWICITLVGMAIYFVQTEVFYPMWSLGQFPGSNSFGFTHQGWPATNLYADWMPSLELSGSFLLWVSALLLIPGGVHIPGMMFLLGTTGTTITAIQRLYAGTAGSRYSITILEQAMWWELAGWICIYLGFLFALFTGVTPLPNSVKGCGAYWGRATRNVKGMKPKKSTKTGGFGNPCACGDGCPRSCRTTWVGDNTGLFAIWGICFIGGMVVYSLVSNVFEPMWSMGQFDSVNPPFMFTHQSYPSNSYLYAPWMEILKICGAGLLFVSAVIAMIGGLHLPGIFWVLGTGALGAGAGMQYGYGTTGSGNLTNLETAIWLNMAGWASIFVGFVVSVFTGMRPGEMGDGDCCAKASRRVKNSRPRETPEKEEEGAEEEEM